MLIFLGFTIQDWLLFTVLFILILCVWEIRKLKRNIIQEVQKKLFPQLMMYMDSKEMFFTLKNEGFSFARSIEIEDLTLYLEDTGVKVCYILKFENIDCLKPQEKIKLKFKVCDENQHFRPEATERIFPHLIRPPFNIKMSCRDIEDRNFRFLFAKKGEKFYCRRSDPFT